MFKRLLPLLLFFLTTGIFSAFSQEITVTAIDPGPYTPGSTISALLSIGNTTCVRPGNTFGLYLSDASGSFASELLIGTYNGFYASYLNGAIPSGITPGTGYRLRVKSTKPALVSNSSTAFEIRTGAPAEAKLTSTLVDSTNPDVFGLCTGKANQSFNFSNESTSGTAVTATVINELNPGTPVVINFDTQIKSFVAELAHYTIFVKTLAADGTVATKSYLLTNNTSLITFSTQGANTVCLPGGSLEFLVDIDGPNGIKSNFPGNTYHITWGDGQEDVYTLCDIRNNANKISHNYNSSSCGQTFQSGGTIEYNAFGINISAQNTFCGRVGTSISTTAKVVAKPVNNFSFNANSCLRSQISFTNTSDPGKNPNTSSAGCIDNQVTYTWYVDGLPIAINRPKNFVFNYAFTTPGTHTVRLEASSTTALCPPDPVEKQICIQEEPRPSFTLNGAGNTPLCTPTVLKPTNTSFVDNNCSSNTYEWVITGGPVATVNNTTLNSMEPHLSFTVPGTYKIRLVIKTPSCGEFSTPEQTVVVNTQPAAVLSANVTVCNLGDYAFSNTTQGPTLTTLTGTEQPLSSPTTYQWAVSGGAYSYVSGTTENSRFPVINFTEYKTYTITVTHTNNCGTATDTQTITFKQSPEVRAGTYAPVCFDADIALHGTASKTVVAFEWTGGGGTFSPNQNDPNAVYTPSPAERAAGRAELALIATTALAAPCDKIPDYVTILILPQNTITSASAKSICTGTQLGYSPIASVSGSTFIWTVVSSSTNASGANAGSGPFINDRISNSDPDNNAVVVYRITPSSGGCTGTPFDLTVTITPNPISTATAVNPVICSGEVSGIRLSSNLGQTTRYTWTTTSSSPLITGNTDNPFVASTIDKIDDVLTNKGNAPGTVTYLVTPYSDNGCPGSPSSVTVTVNPEVPVANAGPAQVLCNLTTFTLSGNSPGPGTGLWTQVSGNGVTITDPSSPVTSVTGVTPGQNYQFRWTITGFAPCAPSAATVDVTNLPPLQNTISSTDAGVCPGQTILVSGSLPVGGDGTYVYIWESSSNGNTWNVINGQTGQNLSIAINSSTFFRRRVNSGACSLTSSSVQVTTQPPITGNSISGVPAICAGDTPAPLTGSTPSGGDGNYTYQWQSSTDGINWSDISGANDVNFSPPVLTVSTRYRRNVGTIACTGPLQNTSNVVVVIVKPHAKAEFTFVTDIGCVPFEITSQNVKAVPYPDRNAVYTWYVNDVQLGQPGITFPGYKIEALNTQVVIKLMVTSSLGCTRDQTSHTFSTPQVSAALFSASVTEGCGPLTVNFTNTSTVAPGTTYSWNFGNGTSTSANPGPVTFLPDPSGDDKEYEVTLIANTPCGPTAPFKQKITVRAKAIARFVPSVTKGCSPLDIDFTNTSPKASETEYIFDWGDGNPPETKLDRSNISHRYETADDIQTYTVTMTTKGKCGQEASQSFEIIVFPKSIVAKVVVNGPELKGCGPHTVHFYNQSRGAERYIYDFGDGSAPYPVSSQDVVIHEYKTSGSFPVTLTAINECQREIDRRITIEVLPQPTSSFNADIREGCPGLEVRFTDASANAVSYHWDFGDGSFSDEKNPPHIFNGDGPYYTVKLITTNNLGCTDTAVYENYIHILQPPAADFTARPGLQTSIPNYTFKFIDASTRNPDKWHWDFGDGSFSDEKNPSHTYEDVGSYLVRLTTGNQTGCETTVSKTVSITGTPGYLYVPNSFIPGSERIEFRQFSAKGSGLQSWKFSIFNKWGQLLWETTKLDEGRPAEGWDGTFKGQPVPQGVYFWKIEVQLINGSEWKGMSYGNSTPKRTGNINLIR